MTNIDTTVVNVALDSLARDFQASITSVQWVATGYLLALAIAIPLSGWASDRFGGKRVWIVSTGLFLAGSMLAGAAWSLDSLIFFRILQGLGGGMIMPVGMTLVTRAAGPGRVGRVMGILGVQQLLGPVLGPVIGGVLVEHAGWRWIFYVNVPVGALAIAAAARFLPQARPQPGERLDGRGFLLLSPGLAALVYGLAETANGGFADPRACVPIVLGLALVTGFVCHARRVRNALIDVRLFLKRPFSAGVGTTFFLGMGLTGALFVLPLYYQGVRGQSPLDAGLLLAPQGIGAAIMIPFAGWLTDRVGPGRVVLPGLALVVAGTLPFTLAGTSTPYPLLVLALVVRGVGLGASTMPSMAGAYATLDEHAVARAASALNVMKQLGGSVGVALLAVVLERHLPGATGGVRERPAPTSVVGEAFGRTFWWVLAFSALALIPAAFLPRRPAVAREAAAGTERRHRHLHGLTESG
ncbi:MAG: family efflux transporter permease subunit [Solirubrobacterales bacterium]|nr:family efflux transporter permease subunit [Solirubrobacterales bacterium]